MAKHGEKKGLGGPAIAMIVGAVVVLGGGGIAIAAMTSGGDKADSGSGATSSASASVSASTSSTSSASSSTASSSASIDPAAQQALDACKAEVTAGQALAKAAASSARDWDTHTGAELKFDNGTFTLAQTEAAWGASKANGPADLKSFTAASGAYLQADGACAGVVAKTTGSPLSAQGAACAARGAALASVSKTGTVVNAQWAAHITMMANKAHSDGAAYHARWEGMVKDSQPALAKYRAAAAALQKAPACS